MASSTQRPMLFMVVVAFAVPTATHSVTLIGANPGTCVATHCGVQLAECLVDSICRGWLLCFAGCPVSGNNSMPCQMRCVDLHDPRDDESGTHSRDAIVKFNECIFPEHHCVPRTESTCKTKPVNVASLPAFDFRMFAPKANSTWYVTRGHNPMHDCFDCQVHRFTIDPTDPSGKLLHGTLAYKVREDLDCSPPNCTYLQREAYDAFKPDPTNSAHLMNRNNTEARLHDEDDWYVLAAKPESYILVLYCGCNDASCGYGGATLYTKLPTYDLPAVDVATIEAAIAAAGVDFTLESMCTPSYAACLPPQ